MMPMHFIWNKKADRDKIRALLKAKKVLIGSSDTVLGLLSDLSLEGFQALNIIKQRDEKPYLILIGSYEAAFNFVDQEHLLQIENMLKKCWPGPLTVILPAKNEIPDYMKSKNGEVALRVPHHKGLLAILPYFKGLFSTSANLSGQIVPKFINDVDPTIMERVAGCISDGEVRIEEHSLPSTIISLREGKIYLVREGAYKKLELEKITNKPVIG